MTRTKLNLLVFVVLLEFGPIVIASEPDRDALRQEISELKEIATQLLDRIARIEAQLEPETLKHELAAGDTVVVEILRLQDMEVQVAPTEGIGTEPDHRRRIVLQINKVQPNGDCMLSGQLAYRVNGKYREEFISGVVHQDRVDAARHVKAEDIRDLNIRVMHEIATHTNKAP